MSRRHEDALTQCPYYRYDSEGCIYCEGITGDSILRLGFHTPGSRKMHKRAHCHSAWAGCPIAQMQNRRYSYEP